MTKISKTLVCRRCDEIPELVRQEGGGKVVRCPRCGVSSDRDEVVRAAQEYLARSVMHNELNDFQRRMVSSTKRFKGVSYNPGKLPTLTPPDFIFR